MNTQGIGLGLVICDNIVEQFNGRIGCKSRFNHGSTFIFSILLGADEDYVDKTKVNESLKIPENVAERLNPPPYVSNEDESSLKQKNASVYINDYQI